MTRNETKRNETKHPYEAGPPTHADDVEQVRLGACHPLESHCRASQGVYQMRPEQESSPLPQWDSAFFSPTNTVFVRSISTGQQYQRVNLHQWLQGSKKARFLGHFSGTKQISPGPLAHMEEGCVQNLPNAISLFQVQCPSTRCPCISAPWSSHCLAQNKTTSILCFCISDRLKIA